MYWYCEQHCSSSLFLETIISLSSPPTSDIPTGPLGQLDCIKAAMVHCCSPIQSLTWSQQYLLFLASIGEFNTNKCFEISSKERTITPTPATAVVLDVSAFTAEPGVDIRPTPAQLLLPPIFVAYDRSSTTQGGSSGHSDRASRRQQSRNDLMQLFSVVSPNTSPKLVESVVSRYTTISSLRTAMCAEFEGLQLWYGTPPTPDDINDLLSLIRYSGVLISYWGSYVTRTMCK